MGLSMLASTLLIQSKEDKNKKKNRKKTANAMSDYIAVDIATYLMDATQIRSKKNKLPHTHKKSMIDNSKTYTPKASSEYAL